jgi:hypothetical protein
MSFSVSFEHMLNVYTFIMYTVRGGRVYCHIYDHLNWKKTALNIYESYYIRGIPTNIQFRNILGAFAKWRKRDYWLRHVRLSVRMEQLENTGCLRKGKSTGRPHVSEDNVQRISVCFQRGPKKSTTHASRELGLPRTTVWRVLRRRLIMKPYRMNHFE